MTRCRHSQSPDHFIIRTARTPTATDLTVAAARTQLIPPPRTDVTIGPPHAPQGRWAAPAWPTLANS